MNGTFKNLQVCSLSPEQHQRTCGYWYTVTDGSMAHTAFATERGLLRWLEERGLDLTEPLPERGTFSWQKIKGSYKQVSTMDCNAFEQLEGKHIKVLDNAQYTLGIVTEEDGMKVVNHLNCNVKTRPVYDYWACHSELQ